MFEYEDRDVVSVVLAAAAELREHHHAELAAPDHDLDRVATHATQAALCEQLKRRGHHRVHRHSPVIADHAAVLIHGEAQVRVPAPCNPHLVEKPPADG